jgi:hypothetical protein
MTSPIIVGLLAGKGVYDMAEKVIRAVVASPLVKGVWVLTPEGRFKDALFLNGPKIAHIDHWTGEDSHNKTGVNREVMRKCMYASLHGFSQLMSGIKWIVIGDEDGLPAPHYFEELVKMEYDYPVLLTGKTFNEDGSRFYDICSFEPGAVPICVPYDDWQNPRWAHDLYASGNQHVMNRAAFDLNIPYPDIPGEDPHYCWAMRDAGCKILFRPELTMTLQKMHSRANLRYASE